MSGGSYDYLCWKEGYELFEYSTIGNLERMVDALEEFGYDDAAEETYELVRIIKQARVRANTIHKRLNNVYHAVEWYKSMDSSFDRVEEEIAKYRGEDTDG